MTDYAKTLHETFEVPEGISILDMEQVEMLVSAGEGLMQELVDTFQEECDSKLSELNSASENNQLDEVSQKVHFIAGSAANIGLLRLAELCRNIEMQIKESRLTAMDKIYPTVATEYTNSLAELMEAY